MKLTKELIVNASMLGSGENLSILGCFQIVENVITELMGELKIDGITAKEKYNALWVFTKNRVKMFKSVKWDEKISVTAFLSFKSLVKLNFDAEAKNAAGERIFYARVEACALDKTNYSIRKISTVGVNETILPEPAVADFDFAKFNYAELPLIEQVKIRSTNIDMSHHTNNLEYLRFILNTYSVKDLETKPIKEMEVVYASQSFENDVLNVLKLSENGRDIIVLEKENKPVVKCEILF